MVTEVSSIKIVKLSVTLIPRVCIVGLFLLVLSLVTIFEILSWPANTADPWPETVAKPAEPKKALSWSPKNPAWQLRGRKKLIGLTPPGTDIAPNYSGISVNAEPTPDSSCSTINLWVKVPPGFPFGSVVLPATFDRSDSKDQYFLALSRHFVFFGKCANCLGGGAMGPRTPIASGEWHMLTGMLDLQNQSYPEWRVFVDGILVGTGFGTSDLRTAQLRYLDVRAENTPKNAQVITRNVSYHYNSCLSLSSLKTIFLSGSETHSAVIGNLDYIKMEQK